MNTKKIFFVIALTITGMMGFAQSKKTTATVLNIDTKGVLYTPVTMGNLVRIELEKLDTFQVMDRYDVLYVLEKESLNVGNCYGKICLVEIGNTIKSSKMFTGSVEQFGETIIVTFRLIDVASQSIEKTEVMEFLKLENEIPNMIKITMAKMFGKPIDENQLRVLTKRNNYESSQANKEKPKVNLSGPRTGAVLFTGTMAKYIQQPKNQGGYNAFPFMFQFGYQFEAQYLNEGNYQALFEFIPNITGFNQNVFIPSFTIMNGFRNNKNGLEIAFGPTFNFTRSAYGYYDADNQWNLSRDWTGTEMNPYQIIKRFDSRGSSELNTGFVIAAGKTFKSGKLNIPVNAFWIPSKDGHRVGVSFGFNAKKF